jgi:NAD(P)-dependent dehydrogenase (short-subunit alcohol dehydrogenase family)|tara:strand:- start:9588 stop:10358 length:771 start_codon:yes stop_codon:yes gene_type:complete
MIDLNLSGKRAVVTGASLGIGAAIVKMLAEHGAEVEFCARNADMVDALSKDSKAAGHTADMGDQTSTEEFIQRVLNSGPVDILINNVGASPSRNFLYMSDDDWRDLHELNLLSAVRCTRAFLPGMRKKKSGRVVMISSSAGKYPNAALVDYGATKAAMISISKSLARKYGRDGVLINSVLPGLIHTAMWERAAGEIAEASDSTAEQVITNNGKGVPIGRYGTSEEVAALVVFLCSEAASYINGTAIEVDGGQAGHI